MRGAAGITEDVGGVILLGGGNGALIDIDEERPPGGGSLLDSTTGGLIVAAAGRVTLPGTAGEGIAWTGGVPVPAGGVPADGTGSWRLSKSAFDGFLGTTRASAMGKDNWRSI